jgi:hypothetical protein
MMVGGQRNRVAYDDEDPSDLHALVLDHEEHDLPDGVGGEF